MVLRKVREKSEPERAAIDSVLIEGVGRNLGGNHVDAAIGALAQPPLEFGASAVVKRSGECAEGLRRSAEARRHMLEQADDRRLSVCPGNTDEIEVLAGSVEELGREVRSRGRASEVSRVGTRSVESPRRRRPRRQTRRPVR